MKQMTRIFLTATFFVCLSAISSIGQTFTLDNFTSPKDDGTGLYKADLMVKNQSLNDKSLKVTAFLEEKNPEHTSYFCTGVLCYSPATVEVEYPMSAGKTDIFISYLDPAGINGVSKIRYEFADAGNPSDKTEYTFIFNIGATSVLEQSHGASVAISSPMPNPSKEHTTIQFIVNGNTFSNAVLELYSSDTKHVKTIALPNEGGAVQIGTSELSSGMYFYTLVIDGKKITTSKLAVTR